MRLAGWISVVLAVSVGTAVVTAIGCDVTSSTYAGLPNEVPNHLGSGALPGAGGASSTSTTTGSAGGAGGSGGAVASDAGPAASLCDTAAALVAAVTACQECEPNTCLMDYAACGTCGTSTHCVDLCAGNGPCIAGCIAANPAYQAFIQCVYGACGPVCGQSPPLDCPLGDAGDGG